MVDIAFEPTAIRVARGETVRLRFTNTGKLAHDAFIGTPDEQSDHEDEMREADDADAHGHEEDAEDAVVVEPGKTGELVYTFDEDIELEIGCHQPGHYAAGMKLAVSIT